MRKVWQWFWVTLAFALMVFGETRCAPAQASPYNLYVLKTLTLTATSSCTAVQPLNGLTSGNSTVGSSYSAGSLSLAGTGLTTATFNVQGSFDNGATFVALLLSPSTAPTSTATSITTTANGVWQFNLASVSHIKICTTGTFTATSIALTVSLTPNGVVARSNSSGGTTIGGSPSPNFVPIGIDGASSAWGQLTAAQITPGIAGIFGLQAISMIDANRTLSTPEATHYYLNIASSVSLTATRNVVLPITGGQSFAVANNTTGGHSIVAIGTSGTGVTVANGTAVIVGFDGTNYVALSGVGGSGTPPGNPTNLIFNNAGAYGGDTSTSDDGAGNLGMVSVTNTKETINGTRASCMRNSALVTCLQASVTVGTPVSTDGQEDNNVISPTITAYGGGSSSGQGQRAVKAVPFTVNDGVRGVGQGSGAVLSKHGAGDSSGNYTYNFNDGSAGQFPNDEGNNAATHQEQENDSYFHGTSTSTQNTNLPALTYVSGPNWTTDGSILLNITKGTISGNLAGTASAISGTSGLIGSIPVSGVTLPLSTSYAVSSSALPNNHTVSNVATVDTISFTPLLIGGVSSPLVTGLACIDDPVGRSEQATITVTGSNAAVSHRYPHASGTTYFFQGGLCSPTNGMNYVSIDVDLAPPNQVGSGQRSAYYAFGSLTGADMVVGYSYIGNTRYSMPRGGTPETTTSAFHLYPGREVVANTSTGFDPQLELPMAMTAGDVIENPHYLMNIATGDFVNVKGNSYTDGSGNGEARFTTVSGNVVAGSFLTFRTINGNLPDLYLDCVDTCPGGTGALATPDLDYVVGPYKNLRRYQYGPVPGQAALRIENTWGNTTGKFYVDLLPTVDSDGNTTGFTYSQHDPLTGIRHFGSAIQTDAGDITAAAIGGGTNDVNAKGALNWALGSTLKYYSLVSAGASDPLLVTILANSRAVAANVSQQLFRIPADGSFCASPTNGLAGTKVTCDVSMTRYNTHAFIINDIGAGTAGNVVLNTEPARSGNAYAATTQYVDSEAPLTASVTLGSGTTQLVGVPHLTSAGHCSLFPENSLAATTAGINAWISSYVTDGFNLNYTNSIGAGAIYGVVCGQ